MTNSPSLDQLKQAIALKEQITALEIQLAGILGGAAETPTIPSPVPRSRGRPPGKVGMSTEGRARIAAAQKARRARFHASSGTVPVAASPKKRTISLLHRARLAAAQKARWARVRKTKGA